MSAVPATKPHSPAPSRMTLASVARGKIQSAPRALCYGPEGIGKSTFGAGAPSPIFLGAEDGTGQLDVSRFPQPETWDDILSAIAVLEREPHEYKTLVIDTLDWVEPIIWAHCCERDKEKTIESYGYGKGYQVAVDEWRRLLSALERLRSVRRMGVVLLAHSQIRTFKNPEGEDFDRYELKLHAKAGGICKEWVDAVLFANFETFAQKNEKTKRVKGISTGARLLYTARTAAYDAKNRYSLPESMSLSWDEFAAGVAAGQVAPVEALKAEAERKIGEVAPAVAEKARGALERAGDDAGKLAQLNNWLNTKIGAAS